MVPKAKTLCYPGARVQNTTRLLPTVLPQMPGADTVVVHVGSNDIRRASLEYLKIDFKELILAFKRQKKTANQVPQNDFCSWLRTGQHGWPLKVHGELTLMTCMSISHGSK